MSDDSAVNYLTPEQIRGKRIREGRPMSDNLRDRIAAVICDMDALHAKQWSLDVADAVIRELGLERQDVGLLHRYTTEWEWSADE